MTAKINPHIRKFLYLTALAGLVLSLCMSSAGAPAVRAQGSLPLQPHDIKPMSMSGPDEFGYTSDDTVSLSWIDTALAADTGLTGSGQNNATHVSLPFPFKFYENSFTSLYISTAGYLSFTDNGNWPNSGSIPSPSVPNNVIAPYWAPTYIGSGA